MLSIPLDSGIYSYQKGIKKEPKTCGMVSKKKVQPGKYQIVVLVTWHVHAARSFDGFKKYIIKMSTFKFGQREVASEDIYNQTQITNIFRIDLTKVVFSDKMSCNNENDWQYIVGYQVDGKTVVPLFIKTPKKIFSY